MTQRQRLAIIRYWLSKNGFVSRRRLIGRYFAFVLAISFALAGQGFAKEAKSLVDILDSKVTDSSKAKTQAIAKAEASRPAKMFPKEAKQFTKTLTGTVVSVRKASISVQTGENEATGAEETLLRMDAGVKAKGMKKLSDLKYGDEVKVSYVFTMLPPKEKGGEAVVLDATATEVELVQKAAALAAITPLPAVSPAEGAAHAK